MIEGFELVLLTIMNWAHLFATVAWFGVITTMIFVSVYISESIVPKIAKIAAKGPSPEVGKLQKKQMSLGMFNFILSLIILLLSGYMSAVT